MFKFLDIVHVYVQKWDPPPTTVTEKEVLSNSQWPVVENSVLTVDPWNAQGMRELWTEGTPGMPHMHTHIHEVLLKDKFWTATLKKRNSAAPIFPPSVVWFDSTNSWSDYIIVLHATSVAEEVPAKALPQMAALPASTCESFGPKLFIWLYLSATSVSSVHLCPLWKRKKKKSHSPSPKTACPSGHMSLTLHSFNKIRPN